MDNQSRARDIAVIAGVFTVIAAIIGGIFLIMNTILEYKLKEPATTPTAVAGINATITPTTFTSGDPSTTKDTPTQPVIIQEGTVEDLGLCEYGKPNCKMPDPAGQGQVIFVHGDIDNSGTCHVKEFGTNEIVQGLGSGTFRLIRITGSIDFIKAKEKEIQQIAASGPGAKGICPELTTN